MKTNHTDNENLFEIARHTLGSMMREEREKAGISLREMARRLGISAPYLSDLERGNRGFRTPLQRKFRVELKRGAAA